MTCQERFQFRSDAARKKAEPHRGLRSNIFDWAGDSAADAAVRNFREIVHFEIALGSG